MSRSEAKRKRDSYGRRSLTRIAKQQDDAVLCGAMEFEGLGIAVHGKINKVLDLKIILESAEGATLKLMLITSDSANKNTPTTS